MVNDAMIEPPNRAFRISGVNRYDFVSVWIADSEQVVRESRTESTARTELSIEFDKTYSIIPKLVVGVADQCWNAERHDSALV